MLKRTIYFFFSALIVASVLYSCEEPSSESDAAETSDVVEESKSSDWIVLFDGSNLDAWRNYQQDTISDMWKIEEGALILTGSGGGDIITKETFGSFDLELEWKISEAGNSGIFYHIVEADSLGKVYLSAPEMQVLDDERHPDGKLPSHRAGSNYDMQPCSEVATNPVGEWNKARLLFNNGHVEHWLNGVKVVEFDQGSPAWAEQLANSKFGTWAMYAKGEEGHFGLQDHGDQVWFRNIRVKRL